MLKGLAISLLFPANLKISVINQVIAKKTWPKMTVTYILQHKIGDMYSFVNVCLKYSF